MTDVTQEPGLDAAGLEAARDVWMQTADKRGNWSDALSAAIRAYEAHRSGAGEPVAVKALEWSEHPSLGGGRKLLAFDCFGHEFARLDLVGQSFTTVETFKHHKQVDYEKRILSALLLIDAALSDNPASADHFPDAGNMVAANAAPMDLLGDPDEPLIDPASPAVTDAMIDAAATAFAEERDSPNRGPLGSCWRAALEAALQSAPASMNGTQGEAEGWNPTLTREQLDELGYAIVPKDAIAWLMGTGAGPNGCWFGEGIDPHTSPPYWWRKPFRLMIAAPLPAQGESR